MTHITLWLRLTVVALGLATLACGYRPMSEIAIDPNLPVDEQRAVVEAAEEWFGLVPDARLPIRIGSDRGLGFVTRGECPPGYGRPLALTLMDWEAAPVVLVCSETPAWRFRITVAHELGHALSLREDHIDAGNLMAVDVGEAAQSPTPADASYLEGR